MRKNLRGFFRLSAEEKALFLEAWVTLGVMRGALLTLSFKQLTRGLRQTPAPEPLPELSNAQRQRAERIGRAILRAAAHTPWESACLVQALTARRMLQRRRLPGAFWLGVAKKKREGTDGVNMDAHAWSRCGEVVVTGGGDTEHFTVLSVYAWEYEKRTENLQ